MPQRHDGGIDRTGQYRQRRLGTLPTYARGYSLPRVRPRRQRPAAQPDGPHQLLLRARTGRPGRPGLPGYLLQPELSPGNRGGRQPRRAPVCLVRARPAEAVGFAVDFVCVCAVAALGDDNADPTGGVVGLFGLSPPWRVGRIFFLIGLENCSGSPQGVSAGATLRCLYGLRDQGHRTHRGHRSYSRPAGAARG